MRRAAWFVVVAVVGCGRAVAEGDGSSSNGSSLGAGSGGGSGGGGKSEDPGSGGCAGNVPAKDCGPLKEKIVACEQAGLDCTDAIAAFDKCAATPAVADCGPLKDKLDECKQAGLDCTDVIAELDKCASAPPKYDPCDGYQLLYKDCITAHPNDPFCDQVMAAYTTCEQK